MILFHFSTHAHAFMEASGRVNRFSRLKLCYSDAEKGLGESIRKVLVLRARAWMNRNPDGGLSTAAIASVG